MEKIFGVRKAGSTTGREIIAGPARIRVGLLMLATITKLKFDDYTELVPAFSVVALMSFTYNIGIGLTTGFVLYSLCKAARRALGGGQTRFMAVGGFVAFVLYLLSLCVTQKVASKKTKRFAR